MVRKHMLLTKQFENFLQKQNCNVDKQYVQDDF